MKTQTEHLFYYFHGRLVTGERFTICSSPNGQKTTVAIALCSDKDNFCRRIGRNISRGRIEKGKNCISIRNDKRSPIRTVVEYGSALCSLSASELMERFSL